MTTKSKSLFILIAIPLFIFINIILFKNFKTDNSEVITPIVKIENKSTIVKKRTQHIQEDMSDEEYIDTIEPLSEEQRKINIKKIDNALNKAMMYNTPEKVMKAIIFYQESGNDAKAEEFIDYLLEKFPDYKM